MLARIAVNTLTVVASILIIPAIAFALFGGFALYGYAVDMQPGMLREVVGCGGLFGQIAMWLGGIVYLTR